jgi:O-antigen ligase
LNTQVYPEYIEDFNNAQVRAEKSRDGFWLGVLFFFLIFGPKTPAFAVLPPIRSADFVIVILFFKYWIRSTSEPGSFLFNRNIKFVVLSLIILASVITFSSAISIVTRPEYASLKDFYVGLVLFRCVMVAWIVCSCRLTDSQIRMLLYMIFFVAILHTAMMFFNRIWPDEVARFTELLYASDIERVLGQVRNVGKWNNPNFAGLFINLLALSGLVLFVCRGGIWGLLGLAVYISGALQILTLVASRTAFMVYVLNSIIIVIFAPKRRLHLLVLLPLGFILGAMFIAFYSYIFEISTRMDVVLGGDVGEINTAMLSRYELWKLSLRYASESPVFGIGAAKMFYGRAVDNGYLYALLRTGIVGAFFYILFLVVVMFKSFSNITSNKDVYIKGLSLFAFVVVFQHLLYEMTADFFWAPDYNVVFGFFIGLICNPYLRGTQARIDNNYILEGDSFVDDASICIV